MKHKITVYTLLFLLFSMNVLTGCSKHPSDDKTTVSINEDDNKATSIVEDDKETTKDKSETKDSKKSSEKQTEEKSSKEEDVVSYSLDPICNTDNESSTEQEGPNQDTVVTPENNSCENITIINPGISKPSTGNDASCDKIPGVNQPSLKPEANQPSSKPEVESTPTPSPNPKPETENQAPEITPEEKPQENPSSNMVLKVKNASISIGSSISSVERQLGSANRILKGEYDFKYYVYNNDYSNLVFLFVKDQTVVGFYTDSSNFEFMNIKSNSSIKEINQILGSSYSMSSVISHNKIKGYTLRILMDKIGSGKAVGIYLLPDNASFTGYTEEVLDSMDLMVLDITNSIRVRNQLSPLKWSKNAHVAALKHSKDMAENNYFSHTGLNGSTPGDRLTKAGVNWMTYGENIIGGYGNAILSTHGWLNSSGHRSNLLNKTFTHLGVGFYYDKSSNYRNYCTQNFYK